MREKEERDSPEDRYGPVWFRKPGWFGGSGGSDISRTTENEHHKQPLQPLPSSQARPQPCPS